MDDNIYKGSEEHDASESEILDKILLNDKLLDKDFKREKFNEALDTFKATLEKDEYMISYAQGSAVDSNCKRAMTSVMGPGCYLSNPMFFDWPIYVTLAKTNKGFYGIERGMYGKYIRSFKLKEDTFKFFIDGRILLECKKEDLGEYNIHFDLEKRERLENVVGSIDKAINGSEKKTRWEKNSNKTILVEVLIIILAIIIIYFLV